VNVADVTPDKLYIARDTQTRDGISTMYLLDQGIQDSHRVVASQQGVYQVRTDEASPSGY
jgi:hypothetical protein